MAKKSGFYNSNFHIPDELNKSYIPELDGLRALAILSVIFSHIVLNTFLSKYDIGKLGVEIFFVMSGFLITTLLLKEKVKTGKVSLKKFYIRRALRILPVAYLFLIVLTILSSVFNLNVSAGSLIASALYVKNIHLGYTDNWFTGHFWTLAIEEQFYIIFPFLLLFNLKSHINITCILIVFIPFLQFVGYNNIGFFYTNPTVHEAIFLVINLFGSGTTSILIGSLFSILICNGSIPFRKINNSRFLSFIILIIALAFRVNYADLIDSTYFTSTIFSALVACVIYLFLTQENDFLAGILKNKFLIKIGVLSYSIYIWQQIFLNQQPWAGQFKYAGSLFLNIPALFIVAYISYHFYEFKFLKLKEKFKLVGHNINAKTL